MRTMCLVARLDSDAFGLRVAYSTDSDLTSSPMLTPRVNSRRRTARFRLTGLIPGATYYAQLVAGGQLVGEPTSFLAFPDGPFSFRYCIVNCATSGSNHAVFDYIKARNPVAIFRIGDQHYDDVSINSEDLYDAAFDTIDAQPRQIGLYSSVQFFPMFDDHDYGGPSNETDKGVQARFRRAAVATFRRRMPLPELPEPGPYGSVYYSTIIGRNRMILTDLMTARTPVSATDDADKHMMGPAQEAWWQAECLAAAEAGQRIQWISTKPWIGATPGDGWGGYTTARARHSDFIADNGMTGRMDMACGDMHGLAYDDGTNTDYSIAGTAGVELVQTGVLDRSASVKGGPWSGGNTTGIGRGLFAEFDVTDEGGDEINIEFKGHNSVSGTVPISGSWTKTITAV